MAQKSLNQIIAEEIPNLKVSVVTADDKVLYYDAYASETDVQKLVELLERLKIVMRVERMVF